MCMKSAFINEYSVCCILVIIQASVKGSYTPLADTLKQVDSIAKDDIVKVSVPLLLLPPNNEILCFSGV